MKLLKLISKYEAMKKILKTKNNYDGVVALSEVIADLKYVESQRKGK